MRCLGGVLAVDLRSKDQGFEYWSGTAAQQPYASGLHPCARVIKLYNECDALRLGR